MASLTGHNKIVLKGDHVTWEEGILATAAATPGMHLVLTTAVPAQNRDTYAPGASRVGGTADAGASSPTKIVIEDGLLGKTIDDAYTVGDNVRFAIPKAGDVFLVLAKTGEDIDKGEGIQFDATGKAIAATISSLAESLDDTGGALASDKHIRVRFF